MSVLYTPTTLLMHRLYEDRQMRRPQVVALLREMDYGFDAIASILEDMASGRPPSDAE